MSRNTIQLILSGTDQNASTVIGRISSSLGNLGQIASNALGVMAGNLATAAITRVTELGRALAEDLVSEAPRLEQVAASFEALAESAGQSADVVLASMRDAANGMVADADLMTSYNQAMLLVGESMADQFPALLEIAQASAAATGQEVGFMLDSLVTGIGRASPMILDNLGLTINLAETYENYAASLGIAADEMARAQQQEALLNAVVASGGDFIERLGDNTGGAAATIGQMRVSLQNLKDNALQALLPALQALLAPLGALIEYGPEIQIWAQDAGQWLGEVLPDAIATLSDVFQTLGQFISEHGDLIISVIGGIAAGLAAFSIISTVVGWISGLIAAISAASAAFAAAGGGIAGVVALLGGPVTLVVAAVAAAVALLAAAWTNNWGGIRTTLTEIWQGTLQPAFQQIAAWLQENIPAAIATLSDFWTGRLQPAIQSVVSFFQGSVVPAMSTVASVAQAVLGAAITTLATIWETILQPALSMVWTFFQDSIIPVIAAVADVASATLGLAITALAGLWQNVLQPALESVWAFIQDSVLPIFAEVASFVEDNVGPVFEALASSILPPIQGAFEGISGAVERLVSWLGDFAERIRNLELPDWLTPGSPTPFETGLRGIADAMNELTRIELPRFGYGLQAGGLGAPAGGGGGAGGVTFQGCSFTIQAENGEDLLQQLQDLAG